MDRLPLRVLAPWILAALALTAACAGCGRVAGTASTSGPTHPPVRSAGIVRIAHAARAAGRGRAGALARDRWHLHARSPLGTRFGPIVVWTGHELLELGGTAGGRLGGAPRDSGAAYDPVRSRWQRVAAAPASVLPADAASVWTGTEEFVFGGPTLPHTKPTDVAGLYEPTTNRWTVTSPAPLSPLVQTVAVWNGSQVILAGVTQDEEHLQAASFTPATGLWQRLEPPLSAAHPPQSIAMVATDAGVLLWSLWGRARPLGHHSFQELSGVDVLRLSGSDRWANVTGSWPQHETVDQPVFTGTRVLLAPDQIWCGECSPPASTDTHGREVDPHSLRITALPHGPLDDIGPQIVWTGSAEISLEVGGEISGRGIDIRPGDIAFWNPATGRWREGARAPLAPGGAPAVWDGRALLFLAQGGRLLAYGP